MARLWIPLLTVLAVFLLSQCCEERSLTDPIGTALREEFQLGEHYQKVVMVGELPVVSSGKVSDAALYEASLVIGGMLQGRSDIIAQLAKNRVRYSVMAVDERTCDLPEHSDLTPPEYWNYRARGLGATKERPAVSCGEENLLHHPGDPYPTESICVHEFAHAIHLLGLNDLDPTFDQRLEKAYRGAMVRGLWRETYASTNKEEYWAEGVQSWFGTNRENDRIHNHVDTRSELLEYDPGLAGLCREVFGQTDWTYIRADDESRQKEVHLRGLDRHELEEFRWTAEEIAAYEKHPKAE